jgi:SAM-dependent methyltransferase
MEKVKCNFCGSHDFTEGPRGRLSRLKKLPMCVKCGSLERHRVLRSVYSKLNDVLPLNLYSCLQISQDISIEPSWFKSYDLSVYAGVNSIDIQDIKLEDESYDVVTCNHVLEHVKDDVQAMKELFRIFSRHGFLELSVPSPISRGKTDDWGFPKKEQFGHYRIYGRDIEDKFANAMSADMSYIKVIPQDPVTEDKDMCFLFFKSLGLASCVLRELNLVFECSLVTT